MTINPRTQRSFTAASLIIILTFASLIALAGNTFLPSVEAVAKDNILKKSTHQIQNLPSDLQAAVNKARYNSIFPSSILPATASEIKLTPNEGTVAEGYGWSVDISGDTAVVGSYLDDTLGTNVGAAYVFVRNNGVWTQQQKLFPSNIADDGFGFAVAISGDRIVVSSRNFSAATASDAGAAYVFERIGASWMPPQRLAAGDAAPPDYFGFKVAISGDTIVVSAHRQFTFVGQEAGAAYVYFWNGTSWTFQQKLISMDGITHFNHFGLALAINGNTIVVGARQDDIAGATNAGSAYVFVRNSPGASWSQQQKLIASDGAAFDLFGQSVDISGDTIVVGASDDDTAGGLNAGSVYVFVRSGNVWSQQANFIASDGSVGDYFGDQVVISGDTLIASAPSDDTPAGVNVGSVYVFIRSANAWTLLRKITPSDGLPYDSFGWPAISGDTVLIGAFYDPVTIGSTNPSVDNVKSTRASVYVFTNEPDNTKPSLTVPSTITREATNPDGVDVTYSVTATDNYDPSPTIKCSPESGSTFPIGTTVVHCTARDSSGNIASDSFTTNVVDPTPPTPTPNPCLEPPPPLPNGTLQKSVALGSAPSSTVSLRAPGTFVVKDPHNLLYNYTPNDSPCSTNAAELDPTSNIRLLKDSGTTWVKLWVDWSALEPYSPEQLRELPEDLRNKVAARKNDLYRNLDEQIRIAHKEKLQVILTVFHSYPLWSSYANPSLHLSTKPDERGNIPGCDEPCKEAHDPVTAAENERRKKENEQIEKENKKRKTGKKEPLRKILELRNPFGRIPMDLNPGGPWAQWIKTLIERYGVTDQKINPAREICSANFNAGGCEDYFRYVDFLEIVNEPNLTHWPQREPDKITANGYPVMPGYVALMFRSAMTVKGDATIRFLGPATADNLDATYKHTAYSEFNEELLKWLGAMNFNPGADFAWSHHNYGDVEYHRVKLSKVAGKDTNSTAWTRQLLVGKWKGWSVGDDNPQLLITESGARLANLGKIYNFTLEDLGTAIVPFLKIAQMNLVKENFSKMDTGELSKGVAMVNNYLTYTDPKYDTGLMDFNGTEDDWRGRVCGYEKDNKTPKICPTVITGVGGMPRPVYTDAWLILRSSR